MSVGKQYITVMDWMQDELGLTGNDVLCYALIYGFSQDGESEFKGSSSYVAERLHIRKHTALDVLKRLTERGLIRKRETVRNGLRCCYYAAAAEAAPPGAETAPAPVRKPHQPGAKTAPTINVDNKNKINTPHTPQGREAEFDRFWEAYPRKVGKKKAWEKFRKVTAPVDKLLAALEQQKRSDQWTRDGGRYIPHPSTWLYNEGWTDELIPSEEETRKEDFW